MASPEAHMSQLGIDPSDFNMSGSAIAQQEKDKAQKILNEVIKLPENKMCADCNSIGPRWASMNLGVLVCLNCSGIHRRLGVHISKVKSVTLDGWKIKWAQWMKARGNKNSNEYFEANCRTPKPTEQTSPTALEAYIRDKYEFKKWIATGPAKQVVGTEGLHAARRKQEEEDRILAERLQKQFNLGAADPVPAAVPVPKPVVAPKKEENLLDWDSPETSGTSTFAAASAAPLASDPFGGADPFGSSAFAEFGAADAFGDFTGAGTGGVGYLNKSQDLFGDFGDDLFGPAKPAANAQPPATVGGGVGGPGHDLFGMSNCMTNSNSNAPSMTATAPKASAVDIMALYNQPTTHGGMGVLGMGNMGNMMGNMGQGQMGRDNIQMQQIMMQQSMQTRGGIGGGMMGAGMQNINMGGFPGNMGNMMGNMGQGQMSRDNMQMQQMMMQQGMQTGGMMGGGMQNINMGGGGFGSIIMGGGMQNIHTGGGGLGGMRGMRGMGGMGGMGMMGEPTPLSQNNSKTESAAADDPFAMFGKLK